MSEREREREIINSVAGCLCVFSVLVFTIDHVVDNLVSSGQLEECFRDMVRCALLQKHKHLNSRKEHEHKILDHIRYSVH